MFEKHYKKYHIILIQNETFFGDFQTFRATVRTVGLGCYFHTKCMMLAQLLLLP